MDAVGISCRKKAKFDEINMLKSETWKRPTKIPVCVVEDHCDVSLNSMRSERYLLVIITLCIIH